MFSISLIERVHIGAARHIIDMVWLHSSHIAPRKEREKADVSLSSIPQSSNRGSKCCLHHMSDTALTTPLPSQQVQLKLPAPLFLSTLRFSLVVHTDHSDGCDWCERQCVAYLIGPPPLLSGQSVLTPLGLRGSRDGWRQNRSYSHICLANEVQYIIELKTKPKYRLP